jgi:hypothetical protein
MAEITDMLPFFRFDMLDSRCGWFPAYTVWVEAETPEEANERAKEVGVHFDTEEIDYLYEGVEVFRQWQATTRPSPDRYYDAHDVMGLASSDVMFVFANGAVFGGKP